MQIREDETEHLLAAGSVSPSLTPPSDRLLENLPLLSGIMVALEQPVPNAGIRSRLPVRVHGCGLP